MMRRSLRLLLLPLLLFACRNPLKANGTALFVSTDVRALAAVTELELTGREGATVAFGPTLLPRGSDGNVLEGMPTARVLLGDVWAGHTLTVHGVARGADGGVVGAGDSAPVRVVKGMEEDAVLVLAAEEQVPPPTDAGVCTPCTGCCSGSTCETPSLQHCGTGGNVCTACNPATSDRCTNGTCQCGAAADCGPGATCSNGFCTCNHDTCKDGCCQTGRCQMGTTDAACGKNGDFCALCLFGTHCDGKNHQCH